MQAATNKSSLRKLLLTSLLADLDYDTPFNNVKSDCIQHKLQIATTMHIGNLCAIECWYM